jgi:arsenite transporter
MTSVTEISRRRAAPALGTFERYLTLWVALCIIAGIVLGRLIPGPFQVFLADESEKFPCAAGNWRC